MATLTQYWNDEASRLELALAAEQATLATLRNALTLAQAAQRAAADAARDQADAVAAARRALAAIPMPADGDPLLVRMQDALIGLAAARVALANGELDVQRRRADLAARQGRAVALGSELAEARRKIGRAHV